MPVLVETFELWSLIVWFRRFAVGVLLCAVMALGGICSSLACRVPLHDAVLVPKKHSPSVSYCFWEVVNGSPFEMSG